MALDPTQTAEEGSHVAGTSQDVSAPATHPVPLQGTHLEADVTATAPVHSELI
jgi:hypothetical protein